MTAQTLIDFAREQGGLGTDDLLAVSLPLLHQVAAVHATGLVAPLRGIDGLEVDDRFQLRFDRRGRPTRSARIAGSRRSWAPATALSRSRSCGDDRRRHGRDRGGPFARRPRRRRDVTRPVLVPGWETWEHRVGHHDELTDIAQPRRAARRAGGGPRPRPGRRRRADSPQARDNLFALAPGPAPGRGAGRVADDRARPAPPRAGPARRSSSASRPTATSRSTSTSAGSRRRRRSPTRRRAILTRPARPPVRPVAPQPADLVPADAAVAEPDRGVGAAAARRRATSGPSSCSRGRRSARRGLSGAPDLARLGHPLGGRAVRGGDPRHGHLDGPARPRRVRPRRSCGSSSRSCAGTTSRATSSERIDSPLLLAAGDADQEARRARHVRAPGRVDRGRGQPGAAPAAPPALRPRAARDDRPAPTSGSRTCTRGWPRRSPRPSPPSSCGSRSAR